MSPTDLGRRRGVGRARGTTPRRAGARAGPRATGPVRWAARPWRRHRPGAAGHRWSYRHQGTGLGPQLEGCADVGLIDLDRPLEVRDRAGDALHTVQPAAGEGARSQSVLEDPARSPRKRDVALE